MGIMEDCEDCGETVFKWRTLRIVEADDRVLCPSCFERYVRCDNCEGWTAKRHDGNRALCQECYEGLHQREIGYNEISR